MANHDIMVLRCEDQNILEAILKDEDLYDTDLRDGELYIRNNNLSAIHKKVKAISAVTDIIIFASIRYESDRFVEKHLIEFANGEATWKGIDVCYSFSGSVGCLERETENELIDVLTNYYRAYDIVKSNDNGFYVDWHKDELQYTFRFNDYYIESAKNGYSIEFIIYELKELVNSKYDNIIQKIFDDCQQN